MAKKQPKSGSVKRKNRRGRRDRGPIPADRSNPSADLAFVFGIIRKMVIGGILIALGVALYNELTRPVSDDPGVRPRFQCSGEPR